MIQAVFSLINIHIGVGLARCPSLVDRIPEGIIERWSIGRSDVWGRSYGWSRRPPILITQISIRSDVIARSLEGNLLTS